MQTRSFPSTPDGRSPAGAEIRYLMKRARRTGMTSRQLELRSDRRTRHLSITVAALEEKLRSGCVIVVEDTSDLLRSRREAGVLR